MAEFDLTTIKRKMLRKYPAFGSTISSVKYQIVGNNHPVKTAATDGKTIYCNETYLGTLSEDQQVFVFAHEVCHIALNHIMRSEGKDPELWNIATDAVINEHLQKDGLPMVEGGVDIKGALKYDAEELYQKLLAEKQKQQAEQNQQQQGSSAEQKQEQQGQNGQQQNQQQGQGQGSGSSEQDKQESGQDQSQQNSQGQGQGNSEETGESSSQGAGGNGEEQENHDVGHDAHSLWEEAIKEAKEEKEKKQGKGKGQEKQDESQDEAEQEVISEKEAFEKNDEEKIKRAEEIMSKLSTGRRGVGGSSQEVYFDDIGKAGKAVVNWKKLLQRTLEFEDETWGHKFSDRSNGYAARIEDVEYDEQAESEIILDTSGSVSVGLLKSFLRQVKTILKNSCIRVGTFSDSFHGFVEIKKESDIDNLRIRVGGGTNFDAASRAFSKRKDVNRICFTDGQDGGDAEIREKRKDIVWISFENPDFKPDDGKVIFVPASQIQEFKVQEEEREL